MRRIGVLPLLLGWTSLVAAQSPVPAAGAPAPPKAAATVPAQAPPAESKIPAGTAIYLLIVEPAAKSDFNNVAYRTATVDLHKRLAKEFEKQGRYRMMEFSNDAQVVFFVLRFWKDSYPHTLNYYALAVTHEEYEKHVERLNGFRGIAHVEDMLPAALWGTGRDYNMAKHWTAGLATAGLLNLGRPNPVDLVKRFHQDMQ